MMTFTEYQSAAVQTPVCPDALELDLPATGLQQESGKIGRMVVGAKSTNFRLSEAQIAEMRARFGDIERECVPLG